MILNFKNIFPTVLEVQSLLHVLSSNKGYLCLLQEHVPSSVFSLLSSLLLHSVLPEPSPLPISSWLSSQLEELSLWTLCSSLQLVAYYFSHGSTKANLFGEVLEWVQNAGLQIVATNLWHGCQQCQGLETVGCYQMEALLQVSESRYCDNVCSSTPPELHQQYVPQIWGTVGVWAYAQPASCPAKWKHILNV